MVRHTDADAESVTTHEVTVYHHRLADPDAEDKHHPIGKDLGMGMEWCEKYGRDPADHLFDEYTYVEAGTIDVPVHEDEDVRSAAYEAWDFGHADGVDRTKVRGMMVGDVLVVDGESAHFVDRIGFEELDVDLSDEDDEDDEDDEPVTVRESESVDGYAIPTPSDAEIADAFGVDDVDDITDEMIEDATEDIPEPPEHVDVSGYKTAAGAAKATYRALQEWAEFYGQDPDEVVIYDPDETAQKRDMRGGDAWCVAWEGGPYEWASALSGGTTLTGFEGPRMIYDGDPEVEGLHESDGFDVECYYSFDLLFFNR